MNNEVWLSVGGKKYAGWQDVQVEKSISALCGVFQVRLIDTRPFNKDDWPIHMGDSCSVYVGDQLLVTGYIEDLNVEYDKESHMIAIAGRDALGDLVDCHRAVGQRREWVSQTPAAIVKSLVAPFGIPVEIDPSAVGAANSREEMFSMNEGDTVFETMRRVCGKHQIQLITHGDGKLLLTRSGTERACDRLESGMNILRSALKQSDRDRYSHIYVKGVSIGFDEKTLSDFSHPRGDARDQLIRRYRPYVVVEDTNASLGNCSGRAKAEVAVRAGRSRVFEVDVPGWLQSNGQAWRLNQLVQVKDPVLDINSTLLLDQIRFTQGDEGQIATLQLCSPEKYKAEADLEAMKTKFDPLQQMLAGLNA